MKVHLPTYSHGLHQIEDEVNPVDMDLDPEVFYSPISAKLNLDRHDQFLQFHFCLEMAIKLCCDRCLSDFSYSFLAEGPMLYVIGKAPRGEEVDDPEISYIPQSTYELDLSTDLRDLIMLSLPKKHLCSENCKGLCLVCGSDLNTETCNCKTMVDVES